MSVTQPFLVVGDEQRRDPWRIVAGGERTGGLASLTGPPDPHTITAINAKYGVRPADGPPLI
jgi:hypothetical protein